MIGRKDNTIRGVIMEESNTRTRINFSLNAKGFVQWDITAEYDTP